MLTPNPKVSIFPLLALWLILSAGSGMTIVWAIGWHFVTILPTASICAGLSVVDQLLQGDDSDYRF